LKVAGWVLMEYGHRRGIPAVRATILQFSVFPAKNWPPKNPRRNIEHRTFNSQRQFTKTPPPFHWTFDVLVAAQAASG